LGLKRQEFSFRQSKAGGLEGLPKPAPGYRWNEDGSAQELIPGGAAYNKLKTTAMKESKLLDSARTGFASTINIIDQIIGSEDGTIKANPGLDSATGMSGIVTRRTPSTNAKQVQSLLKTLESKIAFGELQKMRSESPTGGALGQVAVKELELLRDSIMPIDPTVSKDDFVKNLKAIRDQIRATERRLGSAFEETYAPLGVGKAKASAAVSDEDLIGKYLK